MRQVRPKVSDRLTTVVVVQALNVIHVTTSLHLASAGLQGPGWHGRQTTQSPANDPRLTTLASWESMPARMEVPEC